MSETPRLDLPYIAESQYQKATTHNQSLDRLDLLVQCSVLDRNLSTPPGAPALGDAYIVGPAPTGLWSGHANHLALYVSSQWEFIAPLPGFQCWVNDEAVQVYWSGTAWVIVSAGGGGATTWLALTDTPNSYAGQAGKAVLVAAGETALEFGTTGGGAPPDATYITATSNGVLTAERVLTDNTQVTWDLTTAGQVGAQIAAHGVALGKLAQILPATLLGNGDATLADVRPITLGAGLTMTGDILSATGGGGGSYTDEQAQDAVGSIFTDSATLDFTYDDATPSLTGSVKDASITEAKLLLADVTTLNVSTTQHGLVPKATGVATHYLDGTGAWSTPAGGGAGGTVVGAMVTRTSFTSGPTSTNIAVSWNTEVRDDANFWASTPNPTRLTIATAGWYTVTASINWDNPTTGGRFLYVRLNGSTIIAEQATNGMADLRQNIAVTRYFAASDYVEIVFFQNSGGTIDLDSAMASIISEFGAGAPATTFLLLTDTPAAYSGQGGNLVTVNSGATALDFTPMTAAGRALLDDADAAAQRTTLGLGTMATQNANAVAITGGTIAGVSTIDSTANITAGGSFVKANVAGDSNIALYSTLAYAGGTYRWFLRHDGDAPSYFGGTVQVATGIGRNRAPASTVGLYIDYLKASEFPIVLHPTDSDANSSAILFQNVANSTVGSIATTASATAFNTSSDARLKRNVQTLTGALERVRALRPVNFKWNSTDELDEGFLAHELQQVAPRAVTGQPDEVNDDGSIRPQQTDASKLIPLLTAGLQAALAQIDALTARLSTLEQALGA